MVVAVVFCLFQTEIKLIELMIPEETKNLRKMSTMKVLSYGALIAQNAYLKKGLSKENMRKRYLIEETKVQARVIGQLKSLMKKPCQVKICM